MGLSYKTRRRLALFILVIGLPAYVVTAVVVMAWLQGPDMEHRPSIWVELAVYVGLGIVWVLPLRRVFLGVARPDPEAPGE